MDDKDDFFRTFLFVISLIIALTPTWIWNSISSDGVSYGIAYVGLGVLQFMFLFVWIAIILPLYKK
ncbi:MAG: hypothetical protein UT05_C0009G0031 [Parcubacteria group bacterium GW2011_GWF2_38_76]|nr:MAG: hypothetical protein UT05_C0009G0031 [Parcubacteria group bacterium GW2011_GWF2_38_76]HBM45472.1 hypothetical protein [Patescibacteria group bacterium]